MDETKIRNRLQREIEAIGNKEFHSLLTGYLPKSLIPLALKTMSINPHQKIGSITREQKQQIIKFLKSWEFEINGILPIERGIVTAGGIDIHEINPKTMASKLIPNLYLAGEIIGIHGPTGGYNLQKAFSTGYVAGIYASE